MKYTLINPETEAQIVKIKHKIRLSMNGIVSGQMAENGIIYKKNYGVSVPRIKEIASLYAPDHDLARRLWNLQIRETMIMATLLEPVETFTPEISRNWIESFTQTEIVEQACMNLFSKLPFANTLCLECVKSNKTWMQITGFVLAARIFNLLDQPEIIAVSEEALKLSVTVNLQLYKSIALCLSRFCRRDKVTALSILKETEEGFVTPTISQQYILNEVKQEILFLDII
jgi:3-methyladenine DNA glycosylase AlkD